VINLKTEKNRHINPGITSLNKTIKEKDLSFQAYSWEESIKQVLAISSAQDVETAIMLFIILTIGMLGIINNIILSALERTREIGMMKALGMREWEIVSVFMVEAIGLGILGGLIGCLFGFVGVWWITEIGYGLGYVGGDMSMYGIPIIDRIYGVWKFSSFIFIFFFGIVVAIFSSIIPAYWAAHKDPVKSIYYR
jgi:putative ABC transport system permease protein